MWWIIVLVCVCAVLITTVSLVVHHYRYCKLYEVDAVIKQSGVTGVPWQFADIDYERHTGTKVLGRRVFTIIVETEFGERDWNYVEYIKDGDAERRIHLPANRSKTKLLTTRCGKRAYSLDWFE